MMMSSAAVPSAIWSAFVPGNGFDLEANKSTAKVSPAAKGFVSKGIRETFIPAVKIKMAVSPKALPATRVTPVISPGKAVGRMTLRKVCHIVAPKAKLASL